MQKRKLIEQGFGWARFIGPIRQVKVRGIKKVDQVLMMAMTAYNLGACAPWGKSVWRWRRRAKHTETASD
jgi:hypothetical protein